MEQQILTETTEVIEITEENTPLVSISEPVQTEVLSLDSEVSVKEIHEESAVLLVLTEGGSLYKKAVNEGYSGTELEWLSELLSSKASVQFVTTTIANANQAYASLLLNLEAKIGDTFASNVKLSEVIAQRDLVRALEYQNLTAKIDNDIEATVTTLTDVMVTRDLAISQKVSKLTADFDLSSARITTTEQAISNEIEARTLAVQNLNSSFDNRISSEINTVNLAISNANSSTATQINTLRTTFNNTLNSSITRLNETITTESSSRASQINTLRTDFLNGISAVLEEVREIKIDTEGNTVAIDSLAATVTNPVSGLSAAFSRANQAWTLADNTAGALSIITAKVNHPSTGLAATYSFAQQVAINADTSIASAINSLRNEITSPTANWIANNVLIQSIESKADDAIEANTTLSSTVSDLNNWKTSTATVQLTSHANKLGVLESRAFLGITNVSNGKATIAGITVDSSNYSIRLQSDVLELVNTSGTRQLYFNTSTGQWEFSGGLVAASFKTALSGFRAELDSGQFPIWYGTGTKNAANANFYVDSLGNVKLKGEIQATTGTLDNVTINNNCLVLGTIYADQIITPGTNSYSWIGPSKYTSISGSSQGLLQFQVDVHITRKLDRFGNYMPFSAHISGFGAIQFTAQGYGYDRLNNYSFRVRQYIYFGGSLISDTWVHDSAYLGHGGGTIHHTAVLPDVSVSSLDAVLSSETVTLSVVVHAFHTNNFGHTDKGGTISYNAPRLLATTYERKSGLSANNF